MDASVTDYTFNGGGKSANSSGVSGGGATHIAKVTGELYQLSSNKTAVLIVAGGGGGDNNLDYTAGDHAGSGGGIKGGDAYVSPDSAAYNVFVSGGTSPTGGTQTGPGRGGSLGNSYNNGIYTIGEAVFGRGGWGKAGNATAADVGDYGGAGGGGWYGGGGMPCCRGGAGGSGYIGSSNLISIGSYTKHMVGFNVPTSTDANTYTTSTSTNYSETATADYAKQGNGYARITYLGTSI